LRYWDDSRGRASAAGVTLIESLVALGVLVIVLTLGVSGLTRLVKHNARSTEINAMVGHLGFARAEAIVRAREVVVCAVDAADLEGGCIGGTSGWADGYAVIDVASGEVLRFERGISGIKIKSNVSRYTFEDDGSLTAAAGGSLSFCDARDTARTDAERSADVTEPRKVVISGAGRVRVSAAADINCS
jgi:type IV fimbrial biogenesis protein FimT